MIPKSLLNSVTAEIITWLGCTDFDRTINLLQQWDEPTWRAAKLAAIMQGIGSYFSQTLPQTSLYPHLPDWFQTWLDETFTLNTKRVSRLHAELQMLLRDANRAGIPVMPLKGSLLTTSIYHPAAIRPMADLDLMIHPSDRMKMRQLLKTRGFSFVPPKYEKWSHHDLYLNGTGDTVVSRDEHPDNPRPVEIHLDLRSEIWACFSTPDLTNGLWKTSRITTILGEPAYLPADTHHLAYIAAHHLRHFLFGSGRAIHWLDLALATTNIPDLTAIPHLDILYPTLRLASRAFPSHFSKVNWEKLAQSVHPRVRAWSETIPLDERCGLVTRSNITGYGRWLLRWNRWHPTPFRLALAFGDSPLPLAYLRYGQAVLQYSKSMILTPNQDHSRETGPK